MVRALSHVLQPWSGEASTEPKQVYRDAKFCFWKNNKRIIIFVLSREGVQSRSCFARDRDRLGDLKENWFLLFSN